jgi:spermidine synthase
VGLIARKGAAWPLVSDLDKKWLDPELTLGAKRANLNDALDVLGTVVADSESLRRFSAVTRPNTDDHLQVSFKAPWVTYAPQETPRARLKEVLSLWNVAPESTEPEAGQSRLHAYRQAHKFYLEMGLKVKANSDPFLLLNLIQEELFQLIKLSPEFHPAYETLNALANAVSVLHPEQSKAVLGRLQNLQNENTH